VLVEGPDPRGAGQVLAFHDPDGLALELVAHPAVTGWPAARGGQIPASQAIRGLYGVTLWVAECALTETFLTAALGLRLLDDDRIGGLRCYGFDGEGPGARVDVREVPAVGRGLVAVGSVHHMRIRVPDEAALHAWRERLAAQDQTVGVTRDRVYYQAITVVEPGGVRIELATDGPGVAADEEPPQFVHGGLGAHRHVGLLSALLYLWSANHVVLLPWPWSWLPHIRHLATPSGR
jgi:glyoxalase family protein